MQLHGCHLKQPPGSLVCVAPLRGVPQIRAGGLFNPFNDEQPRPWAGTMTGTVWLRQQPSLMIITDAIGAWFLFALLLIHDAYAYKH